MDSTKVYLSNLDSRLDSIDNSIKNLKTITEKSQKVLKSDLDELKNKNNLSFWTPIIVALISAIVGTLLSQLIDRFNKRISDERKEFREVKSKCVNILVRLKESYRQLAMYKFHAEYWWHCHTIETLLNDAEAYYNYHLTAQLKAQAAEEKIGELNADFHSEITKYEKLKGKSFNVDTEKKLIGAIVFKKAKGYDSTIKHDDLKNKHAELDEKELRDSYFTNLIYYQQVIDKM